MPRNPVKRPDGSWVIDNGGLDVHFRLKTDLKPRFLAAFAEDMKTFEAKIGNRGITKRTVAKL